MTPGSEKELVEATSDDRMRLPTSRESIVIAAFVMLAFLVNGVWATSVLAVAGSVALFATLFAAWGTDGTASGLVRRTAPWLAFSLTTYAVVSIWFPGVQVVGRGFFWYLWWAVPIVATGFAVLIASDLIARGDLKNPRALFIACYLFLGLAIAAIAFSAIAAEVPEIDVLEMHLQGSEALWAGANPYTSIEVENTSPFEPDGAVISGYVYTPSVLIAYASAWRLLGDPRWATAISLAALVILLVRPWVTSGPRVTLARISTGLMIAALPFLELLINRGWTDALALPFFLGSALTWRSRPWLAAILLGVGVSTKEYFIVLVPLLLLIPDEFKWRRVAAVGGTVAAIYAPFVVWDTAVLLGQRAALGAAAHRSDSLGLAGLGIEVPALASIGIAVVVAIVFGLRQRSSVDLWLGAAAVLSVLFLTGFQAFINYWMVVIGLAAIVLSMRIERTGGQPSARSSPDD
ncbi:MAG: hypothetical protein ACR2N2_04995 [Acidimicrobiia bacterium]